MKILLICLICSCDSIAWTDHICNPDNFEYVYEVVENYDLQSDDLFLIQYYFVERYYNSCEPCTRRWFECISYCDKILEYEQNFKCQ